MFECGQYYVLLCGRLHFNSKLVTFNLLTTAIQKIQQIQYLNIEQCSNNYKKKNSTDILLPVLEYFPLQKIASQSLSTNLVIALLKEFRLVPRIPGPRLRTLCWSLSYQTFLEQRKNALDINNFQRLKCPFLKYRQIIYLI